MTKTEEALAFAAETLAPEHKVEHPPMAAPTNEARARILEFERELAALPPFDFPVRHLFPKGIYARMPMSLNIRACSAVSCQDSPPRASVAVAPTKGSRPR